MIEARLASWKDRKAFAGLAAERDAEIKKKERKEYWERKFTKLAKGKRLLLALDRGKPSGFLYFTLEFIDYPAPYIELLFVTKKSRRKGTASRLVRKFEHIASVKGFDKIFSSTNPDNKISLRLHKKLGYKKCGYIDGIETPTSREIFLSKNLKNKTS